MSVSCEIVGVILSIFQRTLTRQMTNSEPYTITNFPPTGEYYCNFREFTSFGFASFSPSQERPKVIFVGEPGVGKTCLVGHMKTRTFQGSYNPTIGAAYIEIPCVLNGETQSLAIWDISGNSPPNGLTRQFYRGATVAFICFDLSNDRSFHQLDQWYEAVKKNCAENVCLFLVGCKCDLTAVVPADEIQKFCKARNLEYWATSAKSASGVSDLVKRVCVVSLVASLAGQEAQPLPASVDLGGKTGFDKKGKKVCC
jgi:small GTP-binding protein